MIGGQVLHGGHIEAISFVNPVWNIKRWRAANAGPIQQRRRGHVDIVIGKDCNFSLLLIAVMSRALAFAYRADCAGRAGAQLRRQIGLR